MFNLKKYGSRMIVTVVTIILLIIIGITANGRENITAIENIIGKIITPVQKLFYNTGQAVGNTFKSIEGIGNLKDENERLMNEIAKLKELNTQYEDIIMRTDFLKNEASLKKSSHFTFVSSQVSGKDAGNWFDRFIIDKGANQGINKGDPVIQAAEIDDDVVIEGLIGRVVEVGDNWAKVISIIDEGSNVSFKSIRTQNGGIIQGSIEGEASGYLFDSSSDIVEGDKLLTSGMGGVFIEGLYIGKIESVEKRDEELVQRIKVNSAIDFKNIYEVYVITGTK